MSDLGDVISLFEQFMEEGNEADLELALARVDSHQLRFTEIMEYVQQFRADPELKARTIMAIRRHFGMPLIPGAVCQRKY